MHREKNRQNNPEKMNSKNLIVSEHSVYMLIVFFVLVFCFSEYKELSSTIFIARKHVTNMKLVCLR